MNAHMLDLADGFHIAVVRSTPNSRSYYTELWDDKDWWIPYRLIDGVWARVDRGPSRIRPTWFATVDEAQRALDLIVVEHTPMFSALLRVIDCATGEPVENEQAVAS